MNSCRDAAADNRCECPCHPLRHRAGIDPSRTRKLRCHHHSSSHRRHRCSRDIKNMIDPRNHHSQNFKHACKDKANHRRHRADPRESTSWINPTKVRRDRHDCQRRENAHSARGAQCESNHHRESITDRIFHIDTFPILELFAFVQTYKFCLRQHMTFDRLLELLRIRTRF